MTGALIPLTLRLETEDGRFVKEYRICEGEIQFRQFQANAAKAADWRTMSPAELTDHVMKQTLVSQWLRQRLGWRGLLRACVADQASLFGDALGSNRRAA